MNRKYIKDISKIKTTKDKYVACIGFFDGIHYGHQALIHKTIERAKATNHKSLLITFDPDPWSVLNDKSGVKHITPLKKKTQLVESMGIDEIAIIHFDSQFSGLSPEDFVEKVLVAYGIVELVVGADFKFGYRGSGNAQFLKEHYSSVLHTHEITLQNKLEKTVSSTRIIQTILNGNVHKTRELLGRDYEISGLVVHGAKVGRQIGFPTANMDVKDEFVIPKPGVYAGFVKVKGEYYKSIVNVGHNPTVNTRDYLMIESHILDFSDDIYGEMIHQGFHVRLRDELKFDSVEALIDAMKQDEVEARKILVDINQ